MLEYMEKKQYKKAMEIADTIDWRRVKSVSMLNTVSEIYELNGEFQKSRDILFVAFDRSPGSRKIVYRLGTLALKIDDTDEASDCYEEFVKLAPKDPNQYILKYKILKAQGAPLEDQIAALEDFKKGEYVEKWAYELAKLYHEAGMTAECLEECDDLILWFSEGKYVYQAMELKMKYKPLTPMQQEKYNNSPAGKQKARAMQLQKEKEEEKAAYQQKALKAKAAAEAARAARMAAQAAEEEEPEEAEDDLEESGDVSEEMEVPNNVIEEVAETISEEMDEDSFEEGEMLPEESEEVDEEEPKEEDTMKQSSITKVVKGATLQEALANGVALASGRSLNIEEKAMKEKDEALRVTGQMRIEDILQEWEAKQKQNAEAIEQQKQKDVERIQKEREEAERRREEERLEIERKAAEAEAARKAAEEEAARKAAEEEAARKAAEEEAARKAAEEEAARKAAIEEAAKLAGEEDVAAAGLGETRRIPDDIVKLMEEMGLQEKEEAEDEPEELSLEDALAAHGAEEIIGEMDEEAFEEADYEEGDYEEADFEEEDFEEADYEEADFEEEEFEEAAAEEADFEEEDFEEADYEEADFEEEDFEETDYEEADYEDDFEADFGEEVEADFEDDLEADFEDDFEADFEDDFEEEFEEADYEEDDFFDEEAEEEDEEADFEEEELEIEEPSEEEIQARIKKSKGSGVPFDTGFVVTGRYDLSATSEIGLKAGLTEEQKKLFSYFVPVRGMSEQIVEVLDNDRRAQREGTSKTGNLMVIGRKGSGKTVLAVDIVKAIQKQRNLKQGKVAIVTGESLNKKELTNIIQKLRGGAIIIEKAGKLNSRTIKELNYLMEKKTGELLFVLEDQRKPLERLLTANPDFRKKFTSKLELPVFINDELVTFGQTYAKENGYKLDEMGILALYSRIDVMQREDHAVTVAEVKEIMDEAIAHSQKANVKHLARRVFGKSTDDSDRIILKEEDFKI
ncbi:MAG: hypothetical protein KHY96_05630 [Lachnospiraceae bacterium]|nr:hypothetical protein [Dorea phocaeensis]MBS5132627.1 hypothetical protein [Lachnospiraceae bacterium]